MSAIDRVPVSGEPAFTGLNSTVMVQLAPIDSVAPQVVAVFLNEVASVPVKVMPPLFSVSATVPVFFIVTAFVALAAPTAVAGNVRLNGVTDTAGMGALDDQAVLEAHQYPHIEENLQRLYEKRQKGLLGGGSAGATRQRSKRGG